MKEERIREVLGLIGQVTVAVYGDFCLDAYWLLDPRGSERSAETGLPARAVGRHYYSLGGASNVVANLAALEPAAISVIGVIGDDIFGRELTRQMHALGVDTSYLIVQSRDFDTVTFGKPYLEGNEQPRIDFGFFNKRSRQTDHILLQGMRKALLSTDVLIVNQQVPGSIRNAEFLDQANQLFDEFAHKVVLLDTRHYGHSFRNIYRKTNELEAARLTGMDVDINDVVTLSDVRRCAHELYAQFSKPVFLTRGRLGIVTADESGLHEIPGIQLLKKLDPVGAGDTVTSALALCLGAGLRPAEAAEFANFAAAVTVQKLFQTGTASGAEILEIGPDADYIYQPELALNARQARYFGDSEIEVCYPAIPTGRIRHAVFDHDGTISTLRQGWEQIMAPVMIKAILGDRYQTADETLYHKVENRVVDYIDKSTGIETILQMEALVEMVTEFGIVPAERILDKFGYKGIYNEALMELVSRRIRKLERSELDISDYAIKGSVEFLGSLRERRVTLYLASGTDHEDVIAEAKALGYAGLFDGGIYGALRDRANYSKKMVIDRIMKEHSLEGPELVVFGDGPVEMRESRKREGIAVGIASDEIRRHGLSPEKRTRLIKAGAHIVAPDFSQHDRLLDLLFAPPLV